MRVAVIGAGSWGTALALVLAEAGHEVVLWARTPEVARAINEEHRNPRYLSDYRLPSAIRATAEYAAACDGAEAVVIVTPSAALRSVAADLRKLVAPATPIVICSKGVEEQSGLLPIQVFERVLGGIDRLAALSGPNHAEEVVLGIPAGTVIASASYETAGYFRDLFATPRFRCYTSFDYVGVELCAAFKNIIAIAVGAAYGSGLGDNTAAMLMTRGMAEMSRLVTACGGEALTVMGLAGAGDLIATCTSEHSRNRTFGRALAQGGSLAAFEERTHMVVEGAQACKAIGALAERHGVELPITEAVRAMVWEGASLADLSEELINRPLKTEFWGLGKSGE